MKFSSLFRNTINVVTISLLFFTSVFAQPLPIQWVKQMQGAYSTYATAMANDPAGNLYTAISFAQKMSIGNQSITTNGYTDVCILKTDPAGTIIWHKVITGATWQYVQSMACDAQGNLYLAGNFSGTALFAGTALYTTGGGYDGFLVKMDGNGIVKWAKSMGGAGSDGVSSVALDHLGNVYTAGAFVDTAFFDAGVSLQSVGDYDGFVMQSNATDGSLNWITQLGDANEDIATNVAADGAGHVYIAGTFSVGTIIGTSAFTSVGFHDGFLCSLETNMGAVQWVQHISSTGDQETKAMVVDNHGDVYTTGNFGGALNYGNSGLVSPGYVSVYLIKNNGATGSPVFVQSFVGTGNHHNVHAMAYNNSDKLYLTASFDGSVVVGSNTFVPVGDVDIFLTEMDTLGNVNWADQKGGVSGDLAYALSADAFGNIYTGGFFAETMEYGPTTLDMTGSSGGFMARWGSSSVPTSLVIIHNEKDDAHFFPNPFSNKTTLQLANREGFLSITIKDMLGKTVYASNTIASEPTISLNALAPGVYSVILIDDRGKSEVQKIVKE